MQAKKAKNPPTESQIADSKRLRDLFDKNADRSQLAFGNDYEIGNQGMVWQYLNVTAEKGTVLNINAAIKFARGLKVSVGDFSPTLQAAIDEIAAFRSTATGSGFATTGFAHDITPPHYTHPNPHIAKMVALLEATDDYGRGIAIGAASTALKELAPSKTRVA